MIKAEVIKYLPKRFELEAEDKLLALAVEVKRVNITNLWDLEVPHRRRLVVTIEPNVLN